MIEVEFLGRQESEITSTISGTSTSRKMNLGLMWSNNATTIGYFLWMVYGAKLFECH